MTRAMLIELAGELFAERGYVETSIRDITRRGEVTSGAIYGHFRNKADLLAEAISARTEAELEAQSVEPGEEADYIETLTRLASEYAKRRRLRALIVQGAAAAQTDEETRTRLREEQQSHLDGWVQGYQQARDGMGIDPSVDLPTFVLLTWAIELGLGVLESVGIEPRSKKTWADAHNRVARAMQLPPDEQERKRPRRTARKRA
jgi:AcrR family transcriptional regulator